MLKFLIIRFFVLLKQKKVPSSLVGVTLEKKNTLNFLHAAFWRVERVKQVLLTRKTVFYELL